MNLRLGAVLVLVLAPFILADNTENGRPSDVQPESAHPSVILQGLYKKLTGRLTNPVGVAPHVSGGVEAPLHAYPHVAVLYMTSWFGDVTLCGGSLISPKWILTAAHCVMNADKVTALLGTHNRRIREYESRQTLGIADVIVEKNYTMYGTDIALLRLERNAELGKYVQTIRLPALSQKNKNFTGSTVEIVGWGKFNKASSETSAVLRNTTTKIISNNDCEAVFPGKITPWRMCSDGSKGNIPCGGDSGGPMSITEDDNIKTVIGLVSLGNKRCEPGEPAVYTRVDFWLEWINKVTGIPLRQ